MTMMIGKPQEKIMGLVDLAKTRTFFSSIRVWILLGFLVFGSDGLKDVRLEVANHIRRGQDVTLRCNYDMESKPVYAVKWYRGTEEFYRYVPKEAPPKNVFPVLGITVDKNISDDHNVILKNASSETNGKYKCVVSAEGNFQTMFDIKDISVVAIGYDSPRLVLEKRSYNPGESGRANCTLEKTYPPVNITWYIDNKQVKEQKVITNVVKDPTDPTLTSTLSILNFTVPNFNPIQFKCEGKLFDLYHETTVYNMQPVPRAPSYSNYGGSPDTLQRSNASMRGSATTISYGRRYSTLYLLSAQLLLFFYPLRTTLMKIALQKN